MASALGFDAGAGSRTRGRSRALVGRDVEGALLPRIGGGWKAGMLIGAVIALLGVVHVRVQIIDQGYQLAQAVERVDALLVERQRLKARVGALRSRGRLNAHAARLGLARPEREIQLAPVLHASAPTAVRMDP